ncbi:MAG: glycosyl hydrolase 53 family protein [Saprospiraceae bacterium]|nr:glycosyl hydrolase 53 family protein [Saprospiraceae bacterium]
MAQLIQAGTAAVKSVEPTVIMMLHVALGGQNHESVSFIDQMVARDVHFDVIGESYYPKWHGTLDDLRDNLTDLSVRYNKDIIVVEYSHSRTKSIKSVLKYPTEGERAVVYRSLSVLGKKYLTVMAKPMH